MGRGAWSWREERSGGHGSEDVAMVLLAIRWDARYQQGIPGFGLPDVSDQEMVSNELRIDQEMISNELRIGRNGS